MAVSAISAESWLEPLDRVRSAIFVRALRVAPLRAVLVEKARRVPALLFLHASVALVLAVLTPTFLLVVGPLVLGVPHLIADVRYLVLRPNLPVVARRWLLGGACSMLALRAAELGGLPAPLRFELPTAALWVAGAAVLGATSWRDRRLLVVAVLAGAFGFAAWLAPSTVRLVMAHAHNPLALCVWALMFTPTRGRAVGVLLAVAAATAMLLLTPLSWLGFQHGAVQSLGLHSFVAADQLAPFVSSAPLALGVVSSFAFLQSVHYAVWLHAIPQQVTRGEGTLTFRMSFRAARAELGPLGLLVAVSIVILVPTFGLLAPLRTQAIYLSLATFHGYLELAALALWWLGREARP